MTNTLEKYKKYPGGFGNRLRNSINFKRKVLSSMTEDVLFLNEGKSLRYLYGSRGEKLFCKTCRQYPRHEEEYENVRELSLSVMPGGSADDFVTGQTESHL